MICDNISLYLKIELAKQRTSLIFMYLIHSKASGHFKTKLLLSHLDTHKNNKICGHLGRSHHPFPSTKIISLNITTNALSSSSIAHKTIFRRRFSESHTSITLLRRSDTLLLYQICGREGGKPDLLSHTHSYLDVVRTIIAA